MQRTEETNSTDAAHSQPSAQGIISLGLAAMPKPFDTRRISGKFGNAEYNRRVPLAEVAELADALA